MNRIVIGEISDSLALEVLGDETVDITYSDPPWGPGNLMYWRTHNGESERPSWSAFLRTFCRIVDSHTREDGHIFVEMGTRWVDELALEMERLGRKETERFTCLYGSPKRPNVLWHSGPALPEEANPEGMSGVAMTSRVINAVARPGALVFDPCTGKGMTARCAVRAGMRFRGIELNPKRAAVTAKWLERNS